MDFDDLVAPRVILTPKEILTIGLKLVNYSDGRISRAKKPDTNTKRFQSHFGCNQYVCAQMFEDLQTTNNVDAKLDDKKIVIDYFLQALNFLSSKKHVMCSPGKLYLIGSKSSSI